MTVLPGGNEPTIVNPSPCCKAESRVYVTHEGITYLRCLECRKFWERPYQRPKLRLVWSQKEVR